MCTCVCICVPLNSEYNKTGAIIFQPNIANAFNVWKNVEITRPLAGRALFYADNGLPNLSKSYNSIFENWKGDSEGELREIEKQKQKDRNKDRVRGREGRMSESLHDTRVYVRAFTWHDRPEDNLEKNNAMIHPGESGGST